LFQADAGTDSGGANGFVWVTRDAGEGWRQMPTGRFFWRLFLINAALLTLGLLLCAWLIRVEFGRYHRSELLAQVRSQAAALETLFPEHFAEPASSTEPGVALPDVLIGFPPSVITLYTPDGEVLAQSQLSDDRGIPSDRPGEGVDPQPDLALLKQALLQGWSQAAAPRQEAGQTWRHVYVRLGKDGGARGVARVALPARGLAMESGFFERVFWRVLLLATLSAMILAVVFWRMWSGPLMRITAAARRIAQGDLSARVSLRGSEELLQMARALNDMRANLAGQLATIDHQRQSLESLLAQLNEGVIVSDAYGVLLRVNPAAVRLLNLPPPPGPATSYEGLVVERCIPQHDLQAMLHPVAGQTAFGTRLEEDFVDDVEVGSPDSAGGSHHRETRLQVQTGGGEISLLARAADIMLPGTDDGDGRQPGRFVVLTDVTALTRALQLRTDFASNASHELRTPLAAIRGAVETLSDMECVHESGAGRSFVEMIGRHCARLEAMVADLLSLSRLEQGSQSFEPARIELLLVLDEVYQRVASDIEAKRLEWRIDVPEGDTSMVVNRRLLLLVLNNLVENAVRHTDAEGVVEVRCTRERLENGKPAVALSVIDTGCGIPPEMQKRVFERFFQVGRSRTGTGSKDAQPRGTGLGLSIVRHAVKAMRGKVDLSSTVGKGTVVTVTVPQPEPERPPTGIRG
jgi:signal transduction histidine kinase/HAMP domain-containing protein